MKVTVSNLGILKQAEFETGDLTVICGSNNTGKTYATYALYGFMKFWNDAFNYELLKKEELARLLKSGSLRVELDETSKKANEIISHACKEYIYKLPMVFATSKNQFNNAGFNVCIPKIDYIKIDKFFQVNGPGRKPFFNITKKSGEEFLTIDIVAKSEDINGISYDWIRREVNSFILHVLFGDVFPFPFIASIERTGAVMFQKELDISRNRLLEHISNRDKDIDPFSLIDTYYDRGYALPVKDNVDFIRNLENVIKGESFIVKENPDISRIFDAIAGGGYKVSTEGVYYVPDKSRARLTMGESASSVRSLLNLGIYIRHLAFPGDFLMIDEPELNLHPMNQRFMARLFAKLVNAGIKVFITTHSDYIVKEFNTLIMLKKLGVGAKPIMEEHKYDENELLDSAGIRAYIAKKSLIKVEGRQTRQKHNTFVPAIIGEYGIEVDEFNETINIMNSIQERIIYGSV